MTEPLEAFTDLMQRCNDLCSENFDLKTEIAELKKNMDTNIDTVSKLRAREKLLCEELIEARKEMAELQKEIAELKKASENSFQDGYRYAIDKFGIEG